MGFHNKDELICCFDTHTFISVLQQQIAVQNALEVLRTKSLNGAEGGGGYSESSVLQTKPFLNYPSVPKDAAGYVEDDDRNMNVSSLSAIINH